MSDLFIPPPFTARHPGKFYIGGEWVSPAIPGMLNIRYPATGERVMDVAAASPADVERALRAASAAVEGEWPRMAMTERAAVLRRIGAAMRRREKDLAHAVTLEMGATLKETLAGVRATATLFDYYADLAEQLPEQDQRDWTGGRAFVAYRPVGVVAAIVPWNAPLSLSVLKVAPALVAGCAVILKPAPTTPLDAILLAECFEDAAVPPNVVSVLPGGNDVGDALVRDPRIDKITFTGSTAVGRHIGAIAGERIARQALELGGKSAAIVLDDMDPAEIAMRLVPATMRLTGQACSALTRVLVPWHRHDAIVEALTATFGSIKAGDPMADATDLGPLAIERQRDRVEGYIAAGLAAGAKLALGGQRPANIACGWFLEPTIFAQVDNAMTIAREEIFGPVVSVIPYSDEEQAVQIANDSSYGLYASIYSHDEHAVWRLAPRLRAGNVSRAGLFVDRTLPYGGFKQSGVGREGGLEGLRAFQEQQTVYLPTA